MDDASRDRVRSGFERTFGESPYAVLTRSVEQICVSTEIVTFDLAPPEPGKPWRAPFPLVLPDVEALVADVPEPELGTHAAAIGVLPDFMADELESRINEMSEPFSEAARNRRRARRLARTWRTCVAHRLLDSGPA